MFKRIAAVAALGLAGFVALAAPANATDHTDRPVVVGHDTNVVTEADVELLGIELLEMDLALELS